MPRLPDWPVADLRRVRWKAVDLAADLNAVAGPEVDVLRAELRALVQRLDSVIPRPRRAGHEAGCGPAGKEGVA